MSASELLLFAVPVTTIAGLGLAANRRYRAACRSLRCEGIRANRQVKQLLVDLQQHRGMANALLNGDASFKGRVEAKQLEIGKDIQALETSCVERLMTPRRWGGVKSDWQGLRGAVLGLTQEESFRRHSALIREVLYSMADVAERSQIGGAGAVAPALVNALWNDLPAVAEGLGQARGLGAGVAAKGYCSSVARVKLRFLEERIGETVARVSDDLGDADIAHVVGASLAQPWTEASQAVRDFLALLESKLIEAARPAIDAERYFGAGTQALDAVFRVFDQASEILDGALAGHVRPS